MNQYRIIALVVKNRGWKGTSSNRLELRGEVAEGLGRIDDSVAGQLCCGTLDLQNGFNDVIDVGLGVGSA